MSHLSNGVKLSTLVLILQEEAEIPSRKRVALLSHRQLASTCSVCAQEELQT